ncbi:MAG: aminotransferase class V-fold PLP-dependent enzyme [Planctomycetota bacterium]
MGNSTVSAPTTLPEIDSELIKSSPWRWWRQQMPVTEQWAYFDHAAVAPLPLPAVQAIQKYTSEASQSGDMLWPQWAARCEHLRSLIAEILNANDREICLVPNTTTGINLVAEGFPWQAGDSVVLPEGEFPSNLFPWQNQRSRGVDVRIVPRRDGRVEVDDLMERVDESTRIIAVSWVGYASGYRVDIERLVEEAHRRGVFVFLDAIQGLGMYPLDLATTPVDFLAADGHKWLLGPEGAGVAMIAARHLETLRCCNVGWGSVKNSHNYSNPQMDLREAASRFEPGSANMVGMTGLAASVEMFCQVRRTHGPNAIEHRVVGLADQLVQSLGRLGIRTRFPVDPACRSGIVTFEVPNCDPAEVRKRAIAEKVVVSCRDGGVRASIHAYNDTDDLQRLTDVIANL